MRQRLAQTFFDLSAAHRDMKLDVTIARFRARDTKTLRNHMQAVIRGLLSLKIDNELFEDLLHSRPVTRRSRLSIISEKSTSGRPRSPAAQTWAPPLSDEDALEKGLQALQEPTQDLVAAMNEALRTCDAAFMDMSGYRSYLGPPKDVSSDVATAEKRVIAAVTEFDQAESVLSNSQELQGYNREIIRLLVLARSVRMTTDPIIKLMAKMREMQAQSNHIRVDPPAYAFWKSLNRSNAQVRHDRGTVTPSLWPRLAPASPYLTFLTEGLSRFVQPDFHENLRASQQDKSSRTPSDHGRLCRRLGLGRRRGRHQGRGAITESRLFPP